MFARAAHFALVLSLFFSAPGRAKEINVTIDDFFGDPTNGQHIQYFPPTAWHNGNDCQPCTAKPSPASDAWLGTWHDASFGEQIIIASAQFTGTAVYVNCILTGSFANPFGNTDMTFFIDDDDEPAGVFQRSPNGDTSYQFDVPVFSKTDLPYGRHMIRLEAGHGGKRTLVLLDSIVYTTDDSLGGTNSSSSGPSSTSTPLADAPTSTLASASAPAVSQTSSDRRMVTGMAVVLIIAVSMLVVGLMAAVVI